MSEINPPRGMRDFMPQDCFLRNALISHIREVYENYGYMPMDTPAPERLKFLSAKAGGEADQLMFKILARGKDAGAALPGERTDMALRYDLTVPLCRFYATNQHRLPALFRRYQIAPVWRADRPQRGRLREFVQCDVDVIGLASNLAECEVILATSEALRRLGLGHYVRLSDRRILPTVLESFGLAASQVGDALVSVDKLDKIGVGGVLDEAREYLDGQGLASFSRWVEELSAVGRHQEPALHVLGSAASNCADALEPVLANLRDIKAAVQEASASAPIEIDFSPTLVRGMAYYTGPVFEVWNADEPFSLAGGGRYDSLIGQFLGRDVPACGFSIGFERILTILRDRAAGTEPRRTRAEVLVVLRDNGLERAGLRASAALRSSGLAVELHTFTPDAKKQFKHAEALGIRWIISLSSAEGGAELIDANDRSRSRGDLATLAARVRSLSR